MLAALALGETSNLASQPNLSLFLEPLREARMRSVCYILPPTKRECPGLYMEGSVEPRYGLTLFPSLVPIPVSKSQSLGVGGGNDEADGRGSQLLPSAVCQLPALPIALLQCVAIAPRDQALAGTDPTVKIHRRPGSPVTFCPIAL